MPAPSSFDYAIVRVVPRVEREEFINAGVILFCRSRRFLGARIALDRQRLATLDSGLDPGDVERHLALIPLICGGGPDAGPIGQLPLADRFHWLVSPRSSIIQTSSVHAGLCTDPAATLNHLLETVVCPPHS
ncbi:MAG: DUF3037 domain-containing protein [Anaerolineae bacterium]|nr:DUF3037 domain-containing protein [Anaerolineae bacterium]